MTALKDANKTDFAWPEGFYKFSGFRVYINALLLVRCYFYSNIVKSKVIVYRVWWKFHKKMAF